MTQHQEDKQSNLKNGQSVSEQTLFQGGQTEGP